MIYIKKDILEFITYYFNIGESVSKEIKHIKERIADFGAFKEQVGMKRDLILT